MNQQIKKSANQRITNQVSSFEHPASNFLQPPNHLTPPHLHPASCILHLASCILHLASCILHLASCFLPLASFPKHKKAHSVQGRSGPSRYHPDSPAYRCTLSSTATSAMDARCNGRTRSDLCCLLRPQFSRSTPGRPSAICHCKGLAADDPSLCRAIALFAIAAIALFAITVFQCLGKRPSPITYSSHSPSLTNEVDLIIGNPSELSNFVLYLNSLQKHLGAYISAAAIGYMSRSIHAGSWSLPSPPCLVRRSIVGFENLLARD